MVFKDVVLFLCFDSVINMLLSFEAHLHTLNRFIYFSKAAVVLFSYLTECDLSLPINKCVRRAVCCCSVAVFAVQPPPPSSV